MAKLIIEAPDEKSPGFFKRQYRAIEIQKRAEEGDPEAVKDLVSFLADFVTSHEKDEAITLLWDASEADVLEMMAAITGKSPLAE